MVLEVKVITQVIDTVNDVLRKAYVVSLWSHRECDTLKRSRLNVLGKKYPYIRPLGGYLVPQTEISELAGIINNVDFNTDCKVSVYVRKVEVSGIIDVRGEQAAHIASNIESYIKRKFESEIVPKIRMLKERGTFRGIHKVRKSLEKWINRLIFFSQIDPGKQRILLELRELMNGNLEAVNIDKILKKVSDTIKH